jgi:hypothetical protein
VRLGEVVDVQEEADPARGLVADGPSLVLVGACDQDSGLRAGWADHDPALGSPVVRQRRGVLDQVEAERVTEESDRRFVLLDDHGDELKMHELRLPRRPQP